MRFGLQLAHARTGRVCFCNEALRKFTILDSTVKREMVFKLSNSDLVHLEPLSRIVKIAWFQFFHVNDVWCKNMKIFRS